MKRLCQLGVIGLLASFAPITSAEFPGNQPPGNIAQAVSALQQENQQQQEQIDQNAADIALLYQADAQQQEQINLISETPPGSKGFCYSHGVNLQMITGDTWKTLDGFPNCEITATGGALKISMDFMALGDGMWCGVRLLMDESIVIGTSYWGLEPVVTEVNTWQKRNIMRVISGISSGEHDFTVQMHGCVSGATLWINPGNPDDDNYSGINLLIEEL